MMPERASSSDTVGIVIHVSSLPPPTSHQMSSMRKTLRIGGLLLCIYVKGKNKRKKKERPVHACEIACQSLLARLFVGGGSVNSLDCVARSNWCMLMLGFRWQTGRCRNQECLSIHGCIHCSSVSPPKWFPGPNHPFARHRKHSISSCLALRP